MSEALNWSGYLVVAASNLHGPAYYRKASARLAVKKPALKANEVAIKVEVVLPLSLFVRPALEASIQVPEGDVTPPKIELEALDNIEEVLRDRAGFEIKIKNPDPEGDA